jgi:hypothetical protein
LQRCGCLLCKQRHEGEPWTSTLRDERASHAERPRPCAARVHDEKRVLEKGLGLRLEPVDTHKPRISAVELDKTTGTCLLFLWILSRILQPAAVGAAEGDREEVRHL